MATETNDSGPKTVEMPRTKYQLHYGKGGESVILGGTVLTEEIIAKAKLDITALEKLDAIDMVEVYAA